MADGEEANETVPKGYTLHARRSPVTDAWAPIYARETADAFQLALRLDERHCNSRGFVHGGVIAALADNAMGLSYGVVRRVASPDHNTGAVTISLSIDYVATARIGAWLVVAPRVIKAGGTLGFVDALVTADNIVVARASATFKMLG